VGPQRAACNFMAYASAQAACPGPGAAGAGSSAFGFLEKRRCDMETQSSPQRREPWNKGKLVGQKAPFKPKKIWAIRVRLQMEERTRELALLNLGIHSKLRTCDLTSMRVGGVCQGDRVAARACVLQRKTQRSVQFEITAPTREADHSAYGTHSMRRTRASLIYRRTRNLRAAQLLLGHSKIDSTVRYLGIDVDDALELAEQSEVYTAVGPAGVTRR